MIFPLFRRLVIHYCHIPSRFVKYSSTVCEDRLTKLLKIMPKETNLRHIKQRTLGNIPPPSEAYFQVVGDGSRGSPSVVILITPGYRYLFNCGEGTQRIMSEHKLKLSRVENIFFTTKDWKNTGGFPGLSLTVKDIGVPKLTIHGPEGLNLIYPMTKEFLQVKDLELEHRTFDDPPYKDEAVDMQYIPIFPAESVNGHNYSGENGTKRIRRHSGREIENSTAVAYIGKIAASPGKLVMEECMKRGVPPGPLLAKLKDGHDIQLPNGAVVRSQDVCTPSCPGPVFVVVECPTEKHIDSLVTNEVFKNYQEFAQKDDDRAELVIHFTPSDVLRNAKYQEWMGKFSASTRHLLSNETNDNPQSVAIYRIQAMLNMLDERFFPLLPRQRVDNNGRDLEAEESKKEPDGSKFKLTIPARPLQKYYLRPLHKKLVEDLCYQLKNEDYCNEAKANEGLEEAIQSYRGSLGDLPTPQENEPEVIFLGTGSAIPSKVRNTSGMLIRANRSVILDCGEGSSGQLWRFFGNDQHDEEISRLRGVFVSHPHADHHLGLIPILQERKALFDKRKAPVERLILFLPENVEPYLRGFCHSFSDLSAYFEVVNCGKWYYGNIDPGVRERVLKELEMEDIKILPVEHCPYSYAIVLESKAGWKICYSGDTVPHPPLAVAGKGVDLLIHEATMEDAMEDDAKKKKHSTTSQAIAMGKQMEAKFTLLTHFSQRYAKIPNIDGELPEDVGIAFDNMRVRLSEVQRIPKMLPALRLMFSEEQELMLERSEKRERRKDWERKASLGSGGS